MTMQERPERRRGRRLWVWGGGGSLLLAPPLVLELLDETAGDPGDFVFGALLLVGMGTAFELASRVPDRKAYWAGVAVALAAALVNSWLNLAVGIIGSEDDPANVIYGLVLGVPLLGSLGVGFRPRPMALVMAATAGAQVLAFVAALAGGLGFTGPITVFFVALWLTAAWLFHRAARVGT